MPRLVEPDGPHIEGPENIERIMFRVILALLPAALASILFFGWYCLYLILASTFSALLIERLFQRESLAKRRPFGDGSALLAGLLLGLTLSPLSPWWFPLAGSFFTIVVGKQLFGGLGLNIFNPALVGRLILQLSWPLYLSEWLTPFDGMTTATPLGGYLASYWDLFLGNVPGSIGETSALALLLGGLYLLYHRYISLHVPLSYLITAFFFAFFFHRDPVRGILSGGLFLRAFFMANDLVTSPVTRKGKIFYGVGCGIFTIMIRELTHLPDGVTPAILLMNGFSYLFDVITEGPRFGQPRVIGIWKKYIPVTLGIMTIFLIPLLLGDTLSIPETLREKTILLSEEAKEETRKSLIQSNLYHYLDQADYSIYTEVAGYNGIIKILATYDSKGTLLQCRIVHDQESASLGARIRGDEFLLQFSLMPYQERNRFMENLDTISGATISSMAVALALEQAWSTLAIFLGWEEEKPPLPSIKETLSGI